MGKKRNHDAEEEEHHQPQSNKESKKTRTSNFSELSLESLLEREVELANEVRQKQQALTDARRSKPLLYGNNEARQMNTRRLRAEYAHAEVKSEIERRYKALEEAGESQAKKRKTGAGSAHAQTAHAAHAAAPGAGARTGSSAGTAAASGPAASSTSAADAGGAESAPKAAAAPTGLPAGLLSSMLQQQQQWNGMAMMAGFPNTAGLLGGGACGSTALPSMAALAGCGGCGACGVVGVEGAVALVLAADAVASVAAASLVAASVVAVWEAAEDVVG